MPKVVLPCPFKVGDILRASSAPRAIAFCNSLGGGPFIVDSLSGFSTGEAYGKPCFGIYVRQLGSDELSHDEKRKHHFWPGFFELDPLLNAVKKRRNKP